MSVCGWRRGGICVCVCAVGEPSLSLDEIPTVILSVGSRTGVCAPLTTVNLRDVLHHFIKLLQLHTPLPVRRLWLDL